MPQQTRKRAILQWKKWNREYKNNRIDETNKEFFEKIIDKALARLIKKRENTITKTRTDFREKLKYRSIGLGGKWVGYKNKLLEYGIHNLNERESTKN